MGIDVVRKEAEGSNHVQGFQIAHSLGGGTGSGLGTLLLLKIRDAYPDRLTKTYSIYPSPKVSDTVVEPYNAVLATHQLLENADQTYVVDNEALYSISVNLLKEDHPTYSFLNYMGSQVQMGCTASLRFSGQLNGDLRKLGVNLIPFPRLHFFNMAQAPLLSPRNSGYTKLMIQELTKQVWSGKQFYSNVPIDDGKFLTASMMYRGQVSTQETDENIEKVQETKAEDFVEWIPNNIKSAVIDVPPVDANISATFGPTPPRSRPCSSASRRSSAPSTSARPSSTGTRARAWTRWSSRRPTRTLSISSPSTRTSRTPLSAEMRMRTWTSKSKSTR